MLEIENNVITGYDNSHVYGVLKVPEGVVGIKPFALAEIACKEIVLPKSLRKIEHDAFYAANIGRIEFGSQVAEIGSCAFMNCRAKAILPEGIEKIGAFGVRELQLSSKHRLKLPKALRYLGNEAIGLLNVNDIDIDESLVADYTNMANCIVTSLREGGFVKVHVFQGDKEQYSFILARDHPTDRKFDTYTWRACSLVIRENGISYKDYDVAFGELNDRKCKMEMAIARLDNPISLEKDAKAAYSKYIHDNYRDLVPRDDDLDALQKYGEKLLFTQYRLKAFLEAARQTKNLEVIAYLTDLLNRQYGTTGKSLKI
ncbi:MAG: leucine-rich repeat domain-containing protein [Clostridiales bacterium]|jgi:hypothetical protein|nr:leucine-rich repeat domain-containing protein [Clostridiales bacterium]